MTKYLLDFAVAAPHFKGHTVLITTEPKTCLIFTSCYIWLAVALAFFVKEQKQLTSDCWCCFRHREGELPVPLVTSQGKVWISRRMFKQKPCRRCEGWTHCFWGFHQQAGDTLLFLVKYFFFVSYASMKILWHMDEISRSGAAAAVDTEGGTRCVSITPFSDILLCSSSSRRDTLWRRCSTRPLWEFKALQFKGQ